MVLVEIQGRGLVTSEILRKCSEIRCFDDTLLLRREILNGEGHLWSWSLDAAETAEMGGDN